MPKPSSIVGLTYISSPLGKVCLATSNKGICLISVSDNMQESAFNENHPYLLQCIQELNEYFQHERSEFDIPIDISFGTEFMQSVWEALLAIPYGTTQSYGQVAHQIHRPKASRAVGMGCAKNQLWVVVPCHRVVGSTGKLTGYAGGLDVKEWLLEHEQKKEK